MRLALRELRRRPRRFVPATGALAVLVVLALLLGGLLDGLFLGSTGALRAQDADLVVYDEDARGSVLRSRITPEVREQVDAVEGVARSGGLGIALVGVEVPGGEGLADAAVIGYELPTRRGPGPPDPATAYADRRLVADGVSVGDEVKVGPEGIRIEVVDWIDDASYLLQGGLWVEPSTWREVQRASRPDAAVADGVFQALVVQVAESAEPGDVAAAVDEATGTTTTLTLEEAVGALPGTDEQNATFSALIAITLFVVGLVVALFFALLVIERISLFATLKAIGASTTRLVGGLVLQALVVALVALVVGGGLTAGIARIVPEGIPVRFEQGRALVLAALVLGTAAVASALSVRRIGRIEPASAIER